MHKVAASTGPAARSRFARRIAFRVAAVLMWLCLAAGAAELLTRVVLPAAMTNLRDATTASQPHPRLDSVQKPALDIASQEPGGWVLRYQPNADGLIPPSAVRAKPEEVSRVMILGDSTAVGRSVSQDETVHAHLER